MITGFASGEEGAAWAAQPPRTGLEQLRTAIRASDAHSLITAHFGALGPRIAEAEGGQEAVARFQDMVNAHVTANP